MELRSFSRAFVKIFEEDSVFSSQRLSVVPHWSKGMRSLLRGVPGVIYCTPCDIAQMVPKLWLPTSESFGAVRMKLFYLWKVYCGLVSQRCWYEVLWYRMHDWIWFFRQLRCHIWSILKGEKTTINQVLAGDALVLNPRQMKLEHCLLRHHEFLLVSRTLSVESIGGKIRSFLRMACPESDLQF